jgi:chemotaxis protein methyltransferase CheR
MTLAAKDFAILQGFLCDRSGLHLTPDKGYLLESRLARLLRERRIDSLARLAERLRAGGDVLLERAVVEAMMTHETFFFRDPRSFDLLRDRILPALMAARAREKRLSIWCAACSAGQEPYSVAMMLDAIPALADWSVRILATDLSTAVIERARAGVYSQFEVQRGLPVRLLLRYFRQRPDGWEIEPRLRDRIEFRPFNLLRDAAPFGVFDIVMCRNVMIYFDPATRSGLFQRLRARSTADGVLMLGGAETVLGMTTEFLVDRELPGFYRPAPARAAAKFTFGN